MIEQQGKCAACEYAWFAAALMLVLIWAAVRA